MKTPIRLRLSLSHLLVLLIGMVLAGSLAWLAVEGVYLATQRENLLAQARLTAAAMSGTQIQFDTAEPYSQTTNVIPGIHTRLLDEGGAVVIGVPISSNQSSVQVPPAEDPGFVPVDEIIQRPEIQTALAGQPDTAVRRVESAANRRVLYAAAPVVGENGEVISLVYLATPLPPSGLPNNLAYQLIGAVLAAGVLASIAGILLARGIAHPLETLDKAAAAVSAGDYNQQIPEGGNINELKNLGLTFNEMTDNLRQSTQAKNAFIADVTHELRTPLTVIKGTVETLEDGAVDDLTGRDRLLSSMGKETNRLIRLVNDLLVLTRADASALKLDLQIFDLEMLVQTRVEMMEGMAVSGGVILEANIIKTPSTAGFPVLGDADRLAQVIDNLLDNAIRHSPRESVITISLEHNDDQINCTVSDSGTGITAEHLPYIFERLYRVEASRDRNSGGSGLGLAIAQSLILAHGGTIEAASQEGKGTQISFQLPVKTAT
ncbi:MAG: cell wall metabolism sensor histidine kinase WalK [Anaerolineales bacterium]|nr:cell wall metabolism sensor histidine kinase WalK [Anaerolineales bacterium]